MLSDETKKYFVKALRAAGSLHAAPYRWDEQRERVELMQNKWDLFLWALNFGWEVIFEVFIFYRVIQSSLLAELGVAEMVNLRYKAIVYVLPIAFQLATLVRWEQFSLFANSYMEFYASAQERYVEGGKLFKISNSCDWVIPYIFYLGIAIAGLQSIVAVTRPDQLTLFSSLLPNPRGASPLIRLPIAVLHAYLCFAFCFKMQLYTFAMLGYISPAALVLTELRMDSNRKVTRTVLRSPQDFFHVYKCMELLHGMFNDVVAKVELPCIKAVLMGATILGIYGCFKLEDARVFVLTIVATASMLSLKATYEAMASVYELSNCTLRVWSPVLESKWGCEQVWKSLWPLKTKVGGAYTVRKTIVLIILSVVAEQTVSVLIAF